MRGRRPMAAPLSARRGWRTHVSRGPPHGIIDSLGPLSDASANDIRDIGIADVPMDRD